MKTNIKPSARSLLAAALLLSCTATLAVPKAAENATAEVSLGEATVHPKPAAKAAKNSSSARPVAAKSSATTKSPTQKGASAKTNAKAKTTSKAPAKSNSRK